MNLTITCCGEPRDSRYCQNCGKKLSTTHDIVGLLRHCEGTLSTYKKTLANREDQLMAVDDTIPGNKRKYLEKRVNNLKKTIMKWDTWSTELRKLLEESPRH